MKRAKSGRCQNEDLNVLEIIVSHRVDEHIEDDTLCRTDLDPTNVKRPVVRHVTDDFINDVDEHSSHASTISFPRINFLETDAMFLEFVDDLDNLAGGSSSVGDNSTWFSSQPSATLIPRRCTQSRLFELECYIVANGQILMMIASGAKKPISSHAVCFRFVKHQMLTTFKEFQDDSHRHFKKYSDPKELVPTHHTYWSNHGRTRLLDRSSLIIIAASQSRFYNDSTSSLSKEGSQSTCGVVLTNTRLRRNVHIPSCEGCACRQPGYSKGLSWGPKLKARKTTSASSFTTSCLQSIVALQLQAKRDQAMQQIEEQTRNHKVVSEVKRMQKLIEDMTRTQQGPPHDDP
ncbi:CACTA en-spm transposon protein [Cucumis melo var. makuwa]|uniref:CACTA en-spm transposon protein n=1 Tax=Cucumis melo var. makuwa TaxID=1194695 RepID=A0A5D3DTP7_CUCMM|nr:CACTA en-spm transposon protein [Cucumis melo var. makuwa]TYK26884.1 CACTA en-spm transposon protein [Cucumis melo var. makuwa]